MLFVLASKIIFILSKDIFGLNNVFEISSNFFFIFLASVFFIVNISILKSLSEVKLSIIFFTVSMFLG